MVSPARATSIVAILDAFEEERWPDQIDDPLPGGSDPQRLREAIRTLNEGLTLIRFRGDGSGQRVVWEAANTRAAPCAAPLAIRRLRQDNSDRKAPFFRCLLSAICIPPWTATVASNSPTRKSPRRSVTRPGRLNFRRCSRFSRRLNYCKYRLQLSTPGVRAGLLKSCSRKMGKHVRFFRDRLIRLLFNEGLLGGR